nr:hypothetical protein [uncultured Roseateles sp.]
MSSGAPQYLTHDGSQSGPTRDFWNAALGFRWRRGTLGDWSDAAQAANGSVPHATSSAITGVGRYSMIVTALVKRWAGNGQNKGFYLRTAANAWPVDFAGRTASSADSRPTLTVVTGTGTFVLPCQANACWNTTTYKGLSSSDLFRLVQSQQPAILRFDLSSISGTIIEAKLALSVSALTQGGAVIEVFEADPPTFVVPDVVASPALGIGRKYTSFGGIATDPDTLFSHDFASPGWADGGWATPPDRVLNTETGTTYARGTLAAGTNLSANIRADVSRGTGPNGVPDRVVPELFGQYHLHLESDWGSDVDAIKLPAMGVQFGYWANGGYWQQTTGNGGSPGTGLKVWNAAQGKWEYQGHSIRFLSSMKSTDGSPYADLFGLAIYPYNLDQVGPFPVGEEFNYVALRRQQWYAIDIQVKQNTITGPFDTDGNGSALADGEYRVWINGHLAYENTGYRWRRHPEFGVQGLWVDVYHGGTAVAPSTMHYRIDRVSLAKRYIGPR